MTSLKQWSGRIGALIIVAIAAVVVVAGISLLGSMAGKSPLSRVVLQQLIDTPPLPEKAPPPSTINPASEPYPPPNHTLTPAPTLATRTPNPTRAAMSNAAWAQLMVDLATQGDAQNTWHDGPFSVIEVADIYPGSIDGIRADFITADTVPDVGVIMSGHFRRWGPGSEHTYSYMLMVGDRTGNNGYYTQYSNNLAQLQRELP